MAKSPEFQKKFKSLFENEKSKLLVNLQNLGNEFAYVSEEMMDEVDFTAQALDKQMKLRMHNRESLYLKKIERSLLRIKDGTFGSCETCEEEIELKRLEARPTTTLCFSCKEESERHEQLHIDGHKHKSVGNSRLRLA